MSDDEPSRCVPTEPVEYERAHHTPEDYVRPGNAAATSFSQGRDAAAASGFSSGGSPPRVGEDHGPGTGGSARQQDANDGEAYLDDGAAAGQERGAAAAPSPLLSTADVAREEARANAQLQLDLARRRLDDAGAQREQLLLLSASAERDYAKAQERIRSLQSAQEELAQSSVEAPGAALRHVAEHAARQSRSPR